MRIIGGKYKGKTIPEVKGISARPTTDYGKESLFNILTNKTELIGAKVLDLFCGTGNISFEFASRGANEVICVDQSLATYQFVNTFARQLKAPIKCVKSDVFKFLEANKTSFDIIFCDPPYDMPGVTSLAPIIFKNNFLNEDGILIIEHSKEISMVDIEGFEEQRAYGKVNFSFFSKP